MSVETTPQPLRERLGETLERMLEWREAVGYATDSFRWMLTHFLDYAGEGWPDAPALTAEMLDGWLSHHEYESPNTQAIFMSCLREFCRYARFEGTSDFVPGGEYTVERVAYDPYLFTDGELSALFDAIDSFTGSTCGKRWLPELVLPVWSRLLYCSGMRPGEPPSLLREDVDLGTGDVYIRQTKQNRDRHIIVSEDMRSLMELYDGLFPRDRKWFFELWDGRPYTSHWYWRRWKTVVTSCGVEWRGDRPRPYDLRHAFSSRNLVRWMDAGHDAMSLMPALSAYLGHARLTSTMYYVHLLPERLRRSPGVDWDYLDRVYGKVGAR